MVSRDISRINFVTKHQKKREKKEKKERKKEKKEEGKVEEERRNQPKIQMLFLSLFLPNHSDADDGIYTTDK